MLRWKKKRKRKRKRRGYVRPSRAEPKAGWSRSELARLTGISLRAIRLYLQRRVLPRPPFRGSATRYQRQHLLCLLAIKRLRTTQQLELSDIRARLSSLTAAQLESYATENVPPGALAEALGLALTESTPKANPAALSASAGGDAPWLRAPRWHRIELALGLELHVRDDASDQVSELARRVRKLCAS